MPAHRFRLETNSQLREQVKYLTRKRQQAEGALANALGNKDAGRVSNMWILRVGLLAPNMPIQPLVDWCRDFNFTEVCSISSFTARASRNAFAEIIKDLRHGELKQMLKLAVSAGGGGQDVTISAPHQHDEALFRMRSNFASTAGSLCRNRSSKILNQVLELLVSDTSAKVPVELQPLSKKDASTIATGLIRATGPVREACSEALSEDVAAQITLVHVITGDSIATNDLAARMVWAFMSHWCATLRVVYLIVAILCASHMANLCVGVALSGGQVQNPSRNCTICCATSRLFRHLMVSYSEEFGKGLWKWIEQNVKLLPRARMDPTLLAQSRNLQSLYGQAALPDDLLAAFNGGLSEPVHIVDSDETSLQDVRCLFYDKMYKHCVVVDEHPVQTRMFTFVTCVNIMLRYRLLNLPSSVFSVHSVQPAPENAKRLKGFCAFHESSSEGQKLKASCLALQLTALATSLTAQEAETKSCFIQIKPIF